MSYKFDLAGTVEQNNLLVSSLMYISKFLVHTSAGSSLMYISKFLVHTSAVHHVSQLGGGMASASVDK